MHPLKLVENPFGILQPTTQIPWEWVFLFQINMFWWDTLSLTHWVSQDFTTSHSKSDPRDLWPLRHLSDEQTWPDQHFDFFWQCWQFWQFGQFWKIWPFWQFMKICDTFGNFWIFLHCLHFFTLLTILPILAIFWLILTILKISDNFGQRPIQRQQQRQS